MKKTALILIATLMFGALSFSAPLVNASASLVMSPFTVASDGSTNNSLI